LTTPHVSIQTLQSRSKLTLQLDSRRSRRFITDSGSLVQSSAERYQHFHTATASATQRPST